MVISPVVSTSVRVRVHVGIGISKARVHLPTLGLDGQVYVCMCMGRYSV